MEMHKKKKQNTHEIFVDSYNANSVDETTK